LAVDLPSFMQNLMKTRCLTLSSIANITKHEVKKHSCKYNECSQCGVMWQTDAIGFQKCDLGLPSHLLSLRHLQQFGNFLIPPHIDCFLPLLQGGSYSRWLLHGDLCTNDCESNTNFADEWACLMVHNIWN
jgi:hypothetical protein